MAEYQIETDATPFLHLSTSPVFANRRRSESFGGQETSTGTP